MLGPDGGINPKFVMTACVEGSLKKLVFSKNRS